MKKALIIITSVIILFIIGGTYFGTYWFEMTDNYLLVRESLKSTFTMVLLSALTAHLSGLLGILLAKTSFKLCSATATVLCGFSAAASFLVSGIIILLFGAGYTTCIIAVAIPLFSMSFISAGKNFLFYENNKFNANAFIMPKTVYFKNYIYRYMILPYLCDFVTTVLISFYTVIILGTVKIIKYNTLGNLFIDGDNTMLAGIAVIVAAIFILLLCLLRFEVNALREEMK